ncbi:MAG: hypothetical protein K8R77_02785 [Anaerolineaceae bacterium]|nr:hypothetical protein [Anaerolineaceae bacterium]
MTYLKRLTILLLSAALLIACLPLSPTPVTPSGPAPVDETIPNAVIDVIFTEDSPAVESALLNAIRGAQHSIDLAIYNLTNEEIGDALLEAAQRGVQVRMVMESKSMDKIIPQGLAAAGISIQGDNRGALMHHKFLVIDDQDVWSGSANFTNSGLTSDNNNLVHIRSSRLAENYTTEFEEMWAYHLFGADSFANTPNPQLTVDGVLLESYFSPDDGVLNHLVALVNDAETSIAIMAFSFTSDDLAVAVIQQARQGVEVQIVMDEAQAASNQGGEYENLRQAGLDVHLDGNRGQMHHKVIIIDEQIVSFGSYNFSANAERRNDENVIIAHDPELAGAFMVEFARIYAEAQP